MKPTQRRDVSDDSGIAMLMVVAIIMIMTLLVTTAIAYAMAVKTQSKRDQDWNAALAAAGAGVDDFVARVNKSDSYVATVDCTNLAWKGPKVGSNTCGWTASTAPGWLNVEAGVAKGGQFHYDVDTSSFYQPTQPGAYPGLTYFSSAEGWLVLALMLVVTVVGTIAPLWFGWNRLDQHE